MSPSLVVRGGVLEDAEGIARVRMLSWQSAYKGIMPQDFLDAMDLSDQVERTQRFWPRGEDPAHLVATLESEVVGWTCIKLASEEQGEEPPLWASGLVVSFDQAGKVPIIRFVPPA